MFLRHKIQKGLLTRDQVPKEEEMKTVSEYLTKLEGFPDLEVGVIRETKINKVLKAILKIAAIPREEEFKFKPRSQVLLEKWNKLLAATPAPAPTAAPAADGAAPANGTTNGETKEAAKANGVQKEAEKPAEEKKEEAPAAESEKPKEEVRASRYGTTTTTMIEVLTHSAACGCRGYSMSQRSLGATGLSRPGSSSTIVALHVSDTVGCCLPVLCDTLTRRHAGTLVL